MVNITVDGLKIEAQEGTSVIRAAQKAGIEIPHLCEFEHLTPHGGCRICVVEIEGISTLQTSCTYPVQEGMVVHTNTEKVQKSRKFVLSLLFGERNHFCMYCPATNGDCELQTAAYKAEMDHWPIQPSWEQFPVDSSHPWLVWDQNRCILCQRCVRACTELSGQHTIVPMNRGADMILTTDNGIPWGESSCVKCGTCLQVCPTGAIMDKHSLYMGNDAVADVTKSICVECGLGCATTVYARSNQLMKVFGDWEGEINQGVLCEKGRFKAVEKIGKPRLKTPLIRKNGKLEPISWEEAIQIIVKRFRKQPSMGMISARLSIEALYTFKQLFQALGCEMIVSTEESGNDYHEVLAVIDDPKQAVVSPDMFGKRGKANSHAAKVFGLTGEWKADGRVVFAAIGDDSDIDHLIDPLSQADFLIVHSSCNSRLTDAADLILPATNWTEESGHYLSLSGQLQKAQASLTPPSGIYENVEMLSLIAKSAGVTVVMDWQKELASIQV